jgi:uncharacterized protein (DUF58 family)
VSGALFPPAFYAALAALARRRSRADGGRAAGPRAGRGLLGFEHRDYRPGDDLRQIDWRATARRGRPQSRLREEERGGELRLVLDRSASLTPSGPARDRDQRRLALALGWLHLEAGGRLRVSAAGAEAGFAGFERRGQLQAFLAGLVAPQGADESDDADGRSALARPGPVVWLTDPWSAQPPARRAGARVALLVLPEEDEPPEGGLRLRCAESGTELEVELEAGTWARQWERWLAARTAGLRAVGYEGTVLRCADPDPVGLLTRAEEAGLV